jgi:hypothetical protein
MAKEELTMDPKGNPKRYGGIESLVVKGSCRLWE